MTLAAGEASVSSANTPGRAEGSVFGAYVLEACIEQGPMGRMYRAEHQGLGRRVALKMLDGSCGSMLDLAHFLGQARAAAAVKHPAIVNVFDAGIHEGVGYVVTDLVEGVTLRDFIADRGALDEATLLDIAVPLASALVALHEAGLVHGDLSPDRVFLSEVGAGQMRARMANVTDSKLWRASRSGSGVSAIASPVYMAPEVVLGGADGPLTDQYGLGVLMYLCASGVNPFVLEDPRATLQRITTGEVEPLSSRQPSPSRRLVALIERAMHVDPAQRFTNMLELGHELAAAAGYRSRITWGLGSREGVEHGGAESPPQRNPPLSPRRPHGRVARLSAWAILALAAGVALSSWDAIAGRWRENTRDSPALTPSRDIHGLERRPATPVPVDTELRASRSVANHGRGAAPEVPNASPVMAVPSPSPPPPRAIEAPARLNPATREEARSASRRPKPIRPAAEPPVLPAEPDWMLTPEGRAPQPTFERGTNEALILD